LNTITSLETVDDRTISDHHEKATLLWEEYKDRLGCSTQIQVHFNLHELVQHHNLEQIEAPFTKEDIDNVIKKTALRQSPGPDGFNGLFLKNYPQACIISPNICFRLTLKTYVNSFHGFKS
jgi:hypothetical protein